MQDNVPEQMVPVPNAFDATELDSYDENSDCDCEECDPTPPWWFPVVLFAIMLFAIIGVATVISAVLR